MQFWFIFLMSFNFTIQAMFGDVELGAMDEKTKEVEQALRYQASQSNKTSSTPIIWEAPGKDPLLLAVQRHQLQAALELMRAQKGNVEQAIKVYVELSKFRYEARSVWKRVFNKNYRNAYNELLDLLQVELLGTRFVCPKGKVFTDCCICPLCLSRYKTH